MGRSKLNCITVKLTDGELTSLGLLKDDADIASKLKFLLLHGELNMKRQMQFREEQLGRKSLSNDRKVIEIIEFRNYNDFDVSFTDGIIVYGCSMYQFEHHLIQYPKESSPYIGLSTICKNGQSATIIQFHHKNDITIRFSDGTVVTHKKYSDFLKGSIKNPKYHPYIGKKNAIGDKIIAYKNANDISVKRADDTILEHTTMSDFQKNFSVQKSNELISKASDGSTIKAINYVNERNFDVLFVDSGAIVHCRSLNNFKKGLVRNPNKKKKRKVKSERVGEIITFSNGKTGVISEYFSSTNVTITLQPSGQKIEHCNYSSIKKKHFPKAALEEQEDTSLYYGKKISFNNGEVATIIAYHNYHNVDIQLSNYSVVKNCDYGYITKGMFPYSKLDSTNVSHWKYDNKKRKNNIYREKRKGEKIIFSNGSVGFIHDYVNLHNVSVRFPNGVIVNGCNYTSLKQGHLPRKQIKKYNLDFALKEFL